MAEQENNVPLIKCPQWPNGKTLSHNAMSALKLPAFTCLFEKNKSGKFKLE
jgi:hypothetical protein